MKRFAMSNWQANIVWYFYKHEKELYIKIQQMNFGFFPVSHLIFHNAGHFPGIIDL